MANVYALRCLDNTVDQNKALWVRAVRAKRAERRPVAALGDLTTWPDGTVTWEDLESVPGPSNQWSSNLHKKALVRRAGEYVWKNIGITGKHYILKWGTREYNAPGRSFINCDFTNIPQEHGLYVSNSASTFVDNCTFVRCGSQGVQFAHRDMPYQQYDADNMPYAARPVHHISNSHFLDCGVNGTRPSFNATYFNPGSSQFPGNVSFQDSTFVADWGPDDTGQKGNRSTGAFVITPSQGAMSPEPGLHMVANFHVNNCVFDYTKGDRPIGVVRATASVELQNSCFIARDHSQPYIDIDDKFGYPRVGHVIVRNCVSQGVYLRIWDASGKRHSHSLHGPRLERVYNGRTGELIEEKEL